MFFIFKFDSKQYIILYQSIIIMILIIIKTESHVLRNTGKGCLAQNDPDFRN
jgi:hypothetical protein